LKFVIRRESAGNREESHMRNTIMTGGCAMLALAFWFGPASAAGETPARYTMSPAEGGGFVRLDGETGQMALCQRRDTEWSCREMSEPSGGLSQEVERLRTENQKLKGEIRQMEDIMLGDKQGEGGAKGDRRGGLEFKLPTEQDLDSAMSYAQRMLRKFREKMREIDQDQKGTPL
jgi:hypothetical protein